ncbi:hypothetical protein PIB30_004133 [Stylosanthes scabra]|uniref:ornithine decarboxylase n=1 Tax=Stylosanthes scabra TaxID=79078 RepID=A0ABU6Q3F8_9FABA|nr:hypothetical protein [Stylosanthes scabra]
MMNPILFALNPILSAIGVKDKQVTSLSQETDGIFGYIQSVIHEKPETDDESPFMVLDLGVVMDLMHNWSKMLPTVQPFYAVKCNPNPSLLGTLAALGSSFDCASKSEIETVLSLGVSPDRIIYANPCKSVSHIHYAASVGVNVATFDSKEEVEKIRKWHPKCQLLLRIKPPQDSGARNSLGLKYGALPEEVPMLLQAARDADLTVIGVSFHIGSGGADAKAYHAAIAAAKNTVLRDYQLMELELDDWLVFPNMGAYTISSGTNFNGFSTSAIPTYLTYSTTVVREKNTTS